MEGVECTEIPEDHIQGFDSTPTALTTVTNIDAENTCFTLQTYDYFQHQQVGMGNKASLEEMFVEQTVYYNDPLCSTASQLELMLCDGLNTLTTECQAGVEGACTGYCNADAVLCQIDAQLPAGAVEGTPDPFFYTKNNTDAACQKIDEFERQTQQPLSDTAKLVTCMGSDDKEPKCTTITDSTTNIFNTCALEFQNAAPPLPGQQLSATYYENDDCSTPVTINSVCDTDACNSGEVKTLSCYEQLMATPESMFYENSTTPGTCAEMDDSDLDKKYSVTANPTQRVVECAEDEDTCFTLFNSQTLQQQTGCGKKATLEALQTSADAWVDSDDCSDAAAKLTLITCPAYGWITDKTDVSTWCNEPVKTCNYEIMVNETTIGEEKLTVYFQDADNGNTCTETATEQKATVVNPVNYCPFTTCATYESADQKNRLNMCKSEITLYEDSACTTAFTLKSECYGDLCNTKQTQAQEFANEYLEDVGGLLGGCVIIIIVCVVCNCLISALCIQCCCLRNASKGGDRSSSDEGGKIKKKKDSS